MGNSRWSADDWDTHAKRTAAKTQTQIFTSTSMDASLNPALFGIREAVDSVANPMATPLILAADVTGSMGHLSVEIIKNGLGVIMKEVYDRKPIPDPQIMCCAIGDAYCDQAPLQATQFEASVDPLTDQVSKIWIESGGGGNGGESYNLPWYLAGYRTSCDAIAKRGRKGYLFTIGDEPPHMTLGRDEIRRVFGVNAEVDFSSHGLLDSIRPNWEVFHLRVNDHYDRSRWSDLLGERCMNVFDTGKLAEVIVSTIQVIEGASVADVADSWSGDTSLVVRSAIGGLTPRGDSSGVVAL